MTLVEFLRARLDEDDTAARAADAPIKRRIVELHSGYHECADSAPFSYVGTGDCDTLRLLALPYDQHPDYDPEWRP